MNSLLVFFVMVLFVVVLIAIYNYTKQYDSLFLSSTKMHLRSKLITGASDTSPGLMSNAMIRTVCRLGYVYSRNNTELRVIVVPCSFATVVVLNYNNVKLSASYLYAGYYVNSMVFELAEEVDMLVASISNQVVLYGEGINGNIALASMMYRRDSVVVANNIFREDPSFVSFLQTRAKYNRYSIILGQGAYARPDLQGKVTNLILTDYNDLFDATYMDSNSWDLSCTDYIGTQTEVVIKNENPFFQQVFVELQGATRLFSECVPSKVTTIFYGGFYFVFVLEDDMIPSLPKQVPVVILGGFDSAWFAYKMYGRYKGEGYDCKIILFGDSVPDILATDDNAIAAVVFERLQLFDVAVANLLQKSNIMVQRCFSGR